MATEVTRVETRIAVVGGQEAVTMLRSYRSALASIDRQSAKMKVEVDDSGARAKIAAVQQQASAVAGKTYQSRINVDTAGARQQVAGLSQEVERFQRVALAAAQTIAIGKGFQSAIAPAAQVQQSLKDIQILSGATADEMAKLDASSRTFTDMGTGAKAATDAMTELSRAGVEVADQSRAARDAIALATAGQIDQATSANALTNAVHAFNLQMSDTGRVANLYAGAANASSATTLDLIQAMAQGGQAASAMGQSIDGTLGVLALFADRGIKGSDAGTSLRTMLLRLVPSSKEAQQAMSALGLQFTDAGGNALSYSQVAEQLHTKLANLTNAQRTQALQTIFGTDAFRAANVLFEAGAAGVQKYNDAITKTTAEQVATQRLQTFSGQMKVLNAEWENARIVAGNALLPALTAIATTVGSLVSIFNALPEGVQRSIATFIAFGAALRLVSSISNIVQALTARTVASNAAEAASVRATTVAYEQKAAAELAASRAGLVTGAVQAGELAPSILAGSAAARTQIAQEVPVVVRTVGEVETAGLASKVKAAVAGIGALLGPITLAVAVSYIITETVSLPIANAILAKKAASLASKDFQTLYAQDLAQSARNNPATAQASIDFIQEQLKGAEDALATYHGKAANRLWEKIGGTDPIRQGLIDRVELIKRTLAEAQQTQIGEMTPGFSAQASTMAAATAQNLLFESVKNGSVSADVARVAFGRLLDLYGSMIPNVGALRQAFNEQITALSATAPATLKAQQSIKDLSTGYDELQKTVAGIDLEKGLLGLTKQLPALREVQSTLAAFGQTSGGLDKLVEMGAAVERLTNDLAAGSAAFTGFANQSAATDQSISFLQQFRKGLDDVKASAEAAKKNGVATPDQLELLSKYANIVDNVSAMVEGLDAHKAGDFLGMAKNLPDLIEYDNRLRRLVDQYGGPAGVQIEIQLRMNDALAKNKIDAVLGGLTDKSNPLYAAITVAVQGDEDAMSALKKLRGEVEGIPTSKEIEAFAKVVGIDGLKELSLLIAGINSKTVNVTAITRTVASGGQDVPTGPVRGPYASGTQGAGKGWGWVGDKGGDFSNAELVRFHGGEVVLSHDESMKAVATGRFPAFGSGTGPGGFRAYEGPTGPGTGPIRTIDTTVPGIVRAQYASATDGIHAYTGAVNEATGATKKLADETKEVVSKVIDVSAETARLATRLGRLDTAGVQQLTSSFSALLTMLQKQSEVSLGPNATDAQKQEANVANVRQTLAYTEAVANTLRDMQDPAKDLSGDFADIRANGGPLAENTVRWLSVMREVRIVNADIAKQNEALVALEAAHTEQAAKDKAAIDSIHAAQDKVNKANELADYQAGIRTTRATWAIEDQRKRAEDRWNAESAGIAAAQKAEQSRWAAEAKADAAAKAVRDATYTVATRARDDAKRDVDAAWTKESRQFEDRRTALERYGTERKRQLDLEKKALDDNHAAQIAGLSAQSQLLGAMVQGAGTNEEAMRLASLLAQTNQAKANADDAYKSQTDALQAAIDKETEVGQLALQNLEDEQLAATRNHEDTLARMEAEATVAQRKHDDEEVRIGAEIQSRNDAHDATVAQWQVESDAREAEHQRVLARQQEEDTKRSRSAQEAAWLQEAVRRSQADNFQSQIDQAEALQKKHDDQYDIDKKGIDDLIKKDQARLTVLQDEQSYLDAIASLSRTIADASGTWATNVLAVLQGVPPIEHKAGGGRITTDATIVGEYGPELLSARGAYVTDAARTLSIVRAAAQGAGSRGAQTVVFNPTIIQNKGEDSEAFAQRVFGLFRQYMEQYGTDAELARTGGTMR